MGAGAPDRRGIFVIYLLVTLMPVLLMTILHMLLSKFGKEPDSMFSYVPYFIFMSIGVVIIIQSRLKRARVKGDSRFYAYLFLILGYLAPLAYFINVYRPLTQPIVEVDSVDKIKMVPDNHDYFNVRSFMALPEKTYDRVTTSKGRDIYMYYLGFVPIVTSPQDTSFSTWVMFEKSKKVKNRPSEAEVEEFRDACWNQITTYSYDSIKFFKKYHRNLYNSFLQKSGMVRKPLLIISPSTYSRTEELQDTTYLMLGIYIICSGAFFLFVRTGADDDE